MSESSFKRSSLIGRLILDYKTTEELGKLEAILLDINKHQAEGFTSKSGLLGRQKEAFLWSQIQTIGEDSILVNFDLETPIEFPDSIKSLIGYEIWTNAGNKVGVVTDYLLDSKDGKIISYLFTFNGWKGITEGIYCLSPEDVVSVGSKRLIANNEAMDNAQQYAEGIGGKINKVTEFIKEDYEKTIKDLNVAKQETQVLASQATEKAQALTSQASERTQALASQATEKAQALASQASERTKKITSQAAEKFQEITHQSIAKDDETQEIKSVESEKNSETVE